MSIRFACPTCQSIFTVPEKAAGRQAACPRCGQRLQVPQGGRMPGESRSCHPKRRRQDSCPEPPLSDGSRRWMMGILAVGIVLTGLVAMSGLAAVAYLTQDSSERPDRSEGHSAATDAAGTGPARSPAKGERMTVSGRLSFITMNMEGFDEILGQGEQPGAKGVLLVKMRRGGEATCFMSKRPEHYANLPPYSLVTIEGEVMRKLPPNLDGTVDLLLTDCTLIAVGR